jgi:hypothetical protein
MRNASPVGRQGMSKPTCGPASLKRVPYPVPLGSARNGPPIEHLVCAQQTGRSIAYCATAISQATYEGDGPAGCPPGG